MTLGIPKARIVLKNAVLNVLRGGIGAFVALALPPFLVRSLPTSAFGTWGLLLQLGAYTGVLNFGLQIAVARFVAHYHELEDHGRLANIISTAFAALAGLGAVALAGIVVLTWQLPHIFSQMPASLLGEARLALLLVGGSLAFSLPFGIFNSIFIGLQRNEVPTVILVVGRVAGAGLVVLAAKLGGGLFWMAIGMSAANVATSLTQYWICRRAAPEFQVSWSSVTRKAGRELFGYCFSLSVWSVGNLLVGGLSTTIVGILDFKSLAYFAVAISLTNFLDGLQCAAFDALMPAAAALGARQDARRLGDMLISCTRYGMLISLLGGIPLIICSGLILKLWVGTNYAFQAQPFLRILVAANIIRLSAIPYGVLLIGTGQQRMVIFTPLIAGASNLIFAVLLGVRFGAVGVAWGTVVGAIAVVLCNFVYNMPRTNGIVFTWRLYFKTGILLPLGAALPVIPLSLGVLLFSSNPLLSAVIILPSGALLVVLLWQFALDPQERLQIVRFLGSRRLLPS